MNLLDNPIIEWLFYALVGALQALAQANQEIEDLEYQLEMCVLQPEIQEGYDLYGCPLEVDKNGNVIVSDCVIRPPQ